MRCGLRFVCIAIAIAICLIMIGMVLVMNSEVITRYIFSYSPSWSEDATLYPMIWMVMLGGSVLSLFDDHITLHAIRGALGPRARLVQAIAVRIIVLFASVLFVWTGLGFTLSMWAVHSPGSRISMSIPILSIPISMALIAIFSAILIYRDAVRLLGSQPYQIPDQAEFMDGSFRPSDDF